MALLFNVEWITFPVLCGIIFGYLLFGALVYQALESGPEKRLRSRISDILGKATNTSETGEQDESGAWNDPSYRSAIHFRSEILSDPDQLSEILPLVLEAQRLNVLDEKMEFTDSKWDFWSSFFFSATVITTVGYGHLAPLTHDGRIFTFFYSLFGIVLMQIFTEQMGSYLTIPLLRRIDTLMKEYENKRDYSGFYTKYVTKSMIWFVFPFVVTFVAIPALIFCYIDNWNWMESLWFVYISLTTIGFGDYVSGRELNWHYAFTALYKIVLSIWLIVGLSAMAVVIGLIGNMVQLKPTNVLEDEAVKASMEQEATKKRKAEEEYKKKLLEAGGRDADKKESNSKGEIPKGEISPPQLHSSRSRPEATLHKHPNGAKSSTAVLSKDATFVNGKIEIKKSKSKEEKDKRTPSVVDMSKIPKEPPKEIKELMAKQVERKSEPSGTDSQKRAEEGNAAKDGEDENDSNTNDHPK